MSFQNKKCGNDHQNSNNICGHCNQRQIKSNVEQKWQCKHCKNFYNPEANLQRECDSQKGQKQQSPPFSEKSMGKNCSTCSQSNSFQAKICINCDQQFVPVTKICRQCGLEIEEDQYLNHYQQCLQKSGIQLEQLHKTELCGYCNQEILKTNFQDHWQKCLKFLSDDEINK